ncbi:hypothetical protein BKA62DRAFT_435924 [Auriculariales sp. MPI-PUGE-AT-0066]|nr:hypothetical protein BKA62DRAFT_435924 [Auriculariales sp. MPI-PUGE-AT-0066]
MSSNYLWLGCYDIQPAIHSSCLVITYEPDDNAYGNVYTINGMPPHCVAETLRSISLATHDNDGVNDSPLFISRLLLGFIPDSVVETMSTYVEEAASIINDGAVDEDWTLLVIRSFEDSRFLPAGSLVRATDTLSRGAQSLSLDP